MITYCKDKNIKSKKKFKKYRTLNKLLKSFDTVVNIATTSSSNTLSLSSIGSMAIPTSTATVCGLSIGNIVFY